jgi:hypothetical protein
MLRRFASFEGDSAHQSHGRRSAIDQHSTGNSGRAYSSNFLSVLVPPMREPGEFYPAGISTRSWSTLAELRCICTNMATRSRWQPRMGRARRGKAYKFVDNRSNRTAPGRSPRLQPMPTKLHKRQKRQAPIYCALKTPLASYPTYNPSSISHPRLEHARQTTCSSTPFGGRGPAAPMAHGTTY